MAAPSPPLTFQQEGHTYQAEPNPALPPRLLGSGAYGRVYLYRDTVANELVAVKRLQLTNLPPLLARDLAIFIPRELRNHYVLNHHHVVKLKNVFLDDDDSHLNLVLEYADGGGLLQHVNTLLQRNRGRVSEDDARWFFQQLVVTLDYLHAKGVSHRDIKLENALCKRVPNSPRPLIKVADLGLSRYGPIAQTLGIGTAAYQAPEVMAAEPGAPGAGAAAGAGQQYAAPEAMAAQPGAAAADNPGYSYDARKADIWSAGVLLYAMLVGRYPFPDDMPKEQRVLAMNTRPLPNLPQHLSQECKRLLEALLHPNPAQRISIEGIRQVPWFLQSLPANAFDMTAHFLNRPSPCAKTAQQVEDIITRVVQRLQQAV